MVKSHNISQYILKCDLNRVNNILYIINSQAVRWKGSTRAPDNNGSYLSKLQYEHNLANTIKGETDMTFYRYHSPRSNYTGDQLAKMIQSYCVEVKREVSKLESYSKLPKMDFIKACKVARNIKARSIMIGASSVRLACIFVIDACLDFDEESLSDAVECLGYGFKRTKMNFETYLEMAHKIAEKEKELGKGPQ